MLDIKFIRENPSLVQKSAKDKKVDISIDHVLKIDRKYRELFLSVQKLREERNKIAKEQNRERGKEIKDRLEKEEHALNSVQEKLQEWLLKIPNLPKSDVKVGKDESENKVIKTYEEPTKFNFTPKDHLELGEALDIIDVERAAKVSGARFAYLKGDAVLLEFALVQLAMETLLKEGFIPVIPPVLIHQEITEGLGYWQAGGNEDYYLVGEPTEGKNFYLAGTAEHAIVPMHKDEVFQKKDLPKRYVGFSSAFRREAGSYGKDTKGILRVHQFDKVEMVSFVPKEEDDKEHDYLLSLEEKLFQMLEIPYQVIKMCTGDLGFPAARKYDIEAWMPGQNKYREVTSVSTVTDFQSRRLSIKYQDGNEKKFAHILNGTAFAIGRTIIAILENYQQEDGSIKIPTVLQKYIDKDRITSSK
ncbi:MAG: serine--tRNA ligase [Candidatus Levyibacteriota bacterium]|nr:MAG: serine--tRNA ligase [Candidatus Levybacteria bacterium]